MSTKSYVITEKNMQAIDDAIEVLRDVLRGGPGTEKSLEETRSALAGLLTIYPKPNPTWQPDDAA